MSQPAEPTEIPVLEGQTTIEDVVEIGGDNGLHEEAVQI